jgi:lauroyl/myristoyl acyltransferase
MPGGIGVLLPLKRALVTPTGPARAADVNFRHFLSWKPLFYDGLLPLVRALGPARGDAILGGFGRLLAASWPPRRRELEGSLDRLGSIPGGAAERAAVRSELEGNVLRFLARDCALDGSSDAAFFARFDVRGLGHLEQALARGRGVILVGSHLGAHLSAAHWLYRRGAPLRMLIQRPQHVSRLLQGRFDVATGPHPQSGFFLRRHLTPEEASKRVFRTRAALRDGMIVYLKGDVPWTGANTRPARLLGHDRTFQSLWAEFAALFRVPALPVFCTHLPRGRYALTFDPPMTVARGGEGESVARYIARLEAEILAHPSDAVGHLLWPCYGPTPEAPRVASPRPARDVKEAAAAV